MSTYLCSHPTKATPSLLSLNIINWRDEQGREQKFRLVDKVSARWKNFGEMLGLEYNQLDALKQEKLGRVPECWKRVMDHWQRGGSAEYPPTWEGLYSLLEDMEYGQIAVELKEAVSRALL